MPLPCQQNQVVGAPTGVGTPRRFTKDHFRGPSVARESNKESPTGDFRWGCVGMDQRGAVLLVPVADRAARRLLIGAVPPDEFLEGNLGERGEDAFDG